MANNVNLRTLLFSPLGHCVNYAAESPSSTDSRFRSIPVDVVCWTSFKQDIVDFIRERNLRDDRRVYRHFVVDEREFTEETDVQGTITNTLARVVRDIYAQTRTPIKFGPPRPPNYNGAPFIGHVDRAMWRHSASAGHDIVILPIEVKVPFTASIIDKYHRRVRKFVHMCEQITGYMYRNCLQYAVLSTYEQTFGIRLSSDGILRVSDPISCMDTDPSSIAAVWYLLNKAIQNRTVNFKVSLPDGHREPSDRKRKFDNLSSDSHPNMNAVTPKVAMTRSRTSSKRVFSGRYKGKDVVVKYAKLNTFEAGLLIDEIGIYRYLRDLQGLIIPRILAAGSDGRNIVIIMDDCGRELTDRDKRRASIRSAVRDAVEILHRRGVCHGDLEWRNVLWNDTTKSIFIIDFETSVKACDDRSKRGDLSFLDVS